MFFAKFFINKRVLIALIVLVISLTSLFFLYLDMYFSNKVTHNMSDVDAEQFIIVSLESCNKSPNRNQCYESIAKVFVEKFTPDFFLKIIATNEKRPGIFESCHTAVHFFGQEIYKKKKDVSQALAEGDATCFAGYYHGVLEGYFLEEEILSQIGDDAFFADKIVALCPQTSEKQHDECLHGLGHALMFATESDVPRALALCELVPQQSVDWCYSGVFMENSNSATSQDHPSKYFKKDDPQYPCSILEEKYLSTCYSIQSHYIVSENNGNWEKSFGFCSVIPSRYSMDCYRAIGTSIVGYTQNFLDMKHFCAILGDTTRVEACISGIIGALGQRYNTPFEYALEFCSFFDKEQKTCYQEMINLMGSWENNYTNLQQDCLSIPEISYQKMCLVNLENNGR